MRSLPLIALGGMIALGLPLASAVAATPGEAVMHSPAQPALPIVQADWNGGYGYGNGWHHHYYHHWHHEWRNDYRPWHHYWHHHWVRVAPPPYGY